MDYVYKAKTDRVVDADTIDFLIDLGFKIFVKHRIRLAGIDAPEIFGVLKESEEYKKGILAKERVVSLLFNDNGDAIDVQVKTDKDKTGKYGRYIGWVYLSDGTILNEVLVNEGFAVNRVY